MIQKGALAIAALLILGGCSSGGPSDADQQAIAKDFSAENVAKEYDKAGKHAEAEEVRKGMTQSQQ